MKTSDMQLLRDRFDRIHEALGPALMTFDDFYRCPLDVPCSCCGARGAWVLGLMIHCTNFTRVNLMRHWPFCSVECRGAWFVTGAADEFWPVSEHWNHLHPDDRSFCLSVIVYDGPLAHAEPQRILYPDGDNRCLWTYFGELAAMVGLHDPVALNRWWRMPNRMTGDLHQAHFVRAEAA